MMNLSFKRSMDHPAFFNSFGSRCDPFLSDSDSVGTHICIPSVSSAFLPVSQNYLLILLKFRIIPPENSWVLGEFMLPFSSLLILWSRRGGRLALGSIISFLQPRPSCTLTRKTVSVQSRSFAPAVSFNSLLVFTLTLGLLSPFPQSSWGLFLGDPFTSAWVIFLGGFTSFCFFSRLPLAETSMSHLSHFLSQISQLHFCTFFRLEVAHSSTSSWELGLAVLITFSTFNRKNHGVARSRAITLIDLPAVTPPCTPTSDNIIKHSFSFLSTLVFFTW